MQQTPATATTLSLHSRTTASATCSASQVVAKYLGSDLVGKRYEPLFPYFKDHPDAFRVLSDDYVTNDAGTCVVHQAPGFGEDDYRVHRLPRITHSSFSR